MPLTMVHEPGGQAAIANPERPADVRPGARGRTCVGLEEALLTCNGNSTSWEVASGASAFSVVC